MMKTMAGWTVIKTLSCPRDEITLEGEMDRRLLRAETGAARAELLTSKAIKSFG
jgi:hypothetical protein